MIKKIIYGCNIVFLLILFMYKINAQQIEDNLPFKTGEYLQYRVYYHAPLLGKMTAGVAELHIEKHSEIMPNGPLIYHAVGKGESKGAFNFFYKVRDRFDSWFDAQHQRPQRFKRNTREGGYKVKDDVLFDYHTMRANSQHKHKSVAIDSTVHDMISAYYHARTFNTDSLYPNKTFPLPFYLDDSVYNSVVIYEKTEVIKSKLGKFRCLKVKPMVATGNAFDTPYPLEIWITDDKNRIPILIKSAVVVGSVKAELYEMRNIKYPLEAKVE